MSSVSSPGPLARPGGGGGGGGRPLLKRALNKQAHPPPPFRRATLWEVREETNDISAYYELVIANLLPPLWLSALEE